MKISSTNNNRNREGSEGYYPDKKCSTERAKGSKAVIVSEIQGSHGTEGSSTVKENTELK